MNETLTDKLSYDRRCIIPQCSKIPDQVIEGTGFIITPNNYIFEYVEEICPKWDVEKLYKEKI